MTRSTLHVDVAALQRNWARLQGNQLQLWPVLKANAYGIGVDFAYQLLTSAATPEIRFDRICVSTPSEGAHLRKLGWTGEILCLGAMTPSDIESLQHHNLLPWLASIDFIKRWLSSATPEMIVLNIDSGMGRLGIQPQECPQLSTILANYPGTVEIGSHYACAEDPTSLRAQQAVFSQAISQFTSPANIHLCNTAACVQSHLSAIETHARIGIGLWGVDSSGQNSLDPVLTWQSTCADIRTVSAGQGISYGHEYYCYRDTTIGVVPVGYADGIPIHGANDMPIRIGSATASIIGRVTMDTILVDITDVPSSQWHKPVTIVGDSDLTVESWANCTNRSPYEILCNIGSRPQRISTLR